MLNVDKILKDFNDKPHLSKKLNDVIFLRAKLSYQKEEIEKEYKQFIEKISRQLLEKNKAHLGKIEKDNTSDIIMTTRLYSISANNPLFYHFDSFLVDIRRCVEFCLRMSLLNSGYKDNDKFKVQAFIDHICKDSKNNKSNFVDFLIKNHNWFIEFIKGDNRWLHNLNEYRTDTTHYKLINQIGPCNIEYIWNSLQSFDDKPETKISDIKISGMDINFSDFVNSYLFKLDFFIEQIIKLNNEILDNNSPNSDS